MGNSATINRKYKDRLFNYIFGREENREWTLSLYNAVNGSNYTDPALIEFNTLSDVLFMGMKNDTSFLVFDIMSVYEHQSSLNKNMPLRMLQYVGELYSGYIARNKLNKYGIERIMLPIPKLVTFYNGEQDAEDELTLKLSDSFAPEYRSKADIEVRVRMININYGRNKELMKSCKPLAEYSWFVAAIRSSKADHELAYAVDKTLDSMPDDFIIKSFLVKHRQEVEGMLDTEYKEAEVMELFREDGRKEGIKEGIEKRDREKITEMLAKGKTPEEIADFCGYPMDLVLKVREGLRGAN